MNTYIEQLTDGENLTEQQATEAATAVFEGATEAQIGALLAALRSKGETEAEIAGFARGMRNAARTIEPDQASLVDTCGTGGDDYDTINVSTTSAIVAAGAGVPIAKHGNYSVSSQSGSTDVLDALEIPATEEPAVVEGLIERHGIGFMHAPVFHPAMKAVIGPRRELGLRTIFNVLGPLTNPAGADGQIVGVYDPALVETVASALARLPVEHALVVHGDGLDEICLHGETTVAEVTGTEIEQYTIEPASFGLDRAPVKAVAGGSPVENAATLDEILRGERTGPAREIVLANAGAAIYVSGETSTLKDGVELAEQAIDDGAASAVVTELRTASIAR